MVDVDLGLKYLNTITTSKVIDGAKDYQKADRKSSRLQRQLNRKQKGSRNRHKAIIKLAKAHASIASIRKDTLHKLTSYLAKNHGVIGIEDLNVNGMMVNHKLAKAVADMGFYEFRRQLEYKTKLYGSKLVVIDRWFPSSKTCNHCGRERETLTLSERVFRCYACGRQTDRDFNASLNIEAETRRLIA